MSTNNHSSGLKSTFWPEGQKTGSSTKKRQARKVIARRRNQHGRQTTPHTAKPAPQHSPIGPTICPLAAQYMLQKSPWRKRHPFLFWLGISSLFIFIMLALPPNRLVKNIAGQRIGVVNIEGMILDSAATTTWIDTLQNDANVSGVLVRINSPGGAVSPSQEIYRAVKRLAAAKPVVVSMGAMAASGGYYIALGGEQIYANPSTLTASIGVIMEVPNVEGLMKMLGISSKTLATGDLKGAGSSTRPMTAHEEAYLQTLIQDMYDEFIQTVAKERAMPLETVKKLADGRAMTGRQALDLKLVDHIGDYHDALQALFTLCNITDTRSVQMLEGPEKPSSLLQDLVKSVLDISLKHTEATQQPQFFY